MGRPKGAAARLGRGGAGGRRNYGGGGGGGGGFGRAGSYRDSSRDYRPRRSRSRER